MGLCAPIQRVGHILLITLGVATPSICHGGGAALVPVASARYGGNRSEAAIGIDGSGNIHVCDRTNYIQVFDSELRPLFWWGSDMNDPQEFFQAFDVAFAPNGEILLLVDREVRRYSSSRNLISRFGSEGTGPGQIQRPANIAVDERGGIYVSEEDGRVQKFDANGEWIWEWRPPPPTTWYETYTGLAVASGSVYEVFGNQIFQLDDTGRLIRTIDDSLRGPNSGIAVGSDGKIFVTTGNLQYVRVLSSEGADECDWIEATFIVEGSDLAIGPGGRLVAAFEGSVDALLFSFESAPTASTRTSWGAVKARYLHGPGHP